MTDNRPGKEDGMSEPLRELCVMCGRMMPPAEMDGLACADGGACDAAVADEEAGRVL